MTTLRALIESQLPSVKPEKEAFLRAVKAEMDEVERQLVADLLADYFGHAMTPEELEKFAAAEGDIGLIPEHGRPG